MAGTVNASVDHLVGGNANGDHDVQEAFVAIFNFLDSQFTRIASNYGNSTAALDALGLDYFDASSGQAGRQAFGVWRTNGNAIPAYNIVLCWNASSTWTSFYFRGSTASILDGVGLGAALRDDGTNAWNGGTANAGADAIGTPRWTVGGASTLFTFDHFNESGGTRSSNKDNLLVAVDDGLRGNTGIFHMWADDDSFMIVTDIGRNVEPGMLYIGPYTLLDEITHSLPLIGLNNWQTNTGIIQLNTNYGQVTYDEGGALLPPVGSSNTFQVSHNLGGLNHYPNYQLDSPSYPISKISVFDVSGTSGKVGYLPDWIKITKNISPYSRNNGSPSDLAFFRYWSPTHPWALALPWHSSGPPGQDANRAGTQFTWT